MLDPDFVAPDVDVDHAAMDPAPVLPASVEELVVAALIVENRLCLHVARRRIERGIFLDHSPDNFPVRFYSIHRTITSWSASKLTSLMS
jgi:hypothetical protein